MISPPSSPALASSRSNTAKHHTENDSPPVSPKRSFAQLEEDQLSQPELKRRDVQASKRAPLDPLSASALENRRSRRLQLTNHASYHTLVEPASVPDFVLHAEQSVSSASCGMQRSGTPDALVCSWPPSIPTAGAIRSSHSDFVGQPVLHSSGEKLPSRATCPKPTSTAWNAPEPFQTGPTSTRLARTSGWKSENVLQPIRSRTTSMPSVRRPPGDLWRSEPSLVDTEHQSIDAADLLAYPAPPGLPPRRSALTRSDSSPDLLSHGSVSLSLAHGSQPLSASEHTKAVPPIGAERSHAASITSPKSHTRNFSLAQSHNPFKWCSSPPSLRLQGRRKNETDSLDVTPPENVQSAAGNSKEDLERLLRHAYRNKHAPKIISPLSPLRASPSALDLSVDPAYQSRMPSQWNNPSPRYSQYLPRRARIICDGYQVLDWNATCMHCLECKRDSIRKRLLAFRYRQQQQAHRSQRNKLGYPLRVVITPTMDDDRLVLANRREVFAYELDEEEKSLWEEVAAVTGAEPLSFPHVGAPCAVTAYRRIMDDENDEEVHDDYLEIPGEGFLVNESATLFQVSVY